MNFDLEELFNEFSKSLDSNDRVRTLNRMVMGLNGHDIKDDVYEPKPGDKVLITNYRDPIDGNLVARLAKKKYCIVERAFPIPIGSDGNYHFEYEINVVDGDNWNFLQDEYHILTDKEVEKIENGFRL